MILSGARDRLMKAVDDFVSAGAAGDKYDLTEQADALKTAQGEAWSFALQHLKQFAKATASVTSNASGVVSLVTPNPRVILSLSFVPSTGERQLVRRARAEEAPSNHRQAVTMSMVYVPDVVFPDDEGEPFVWGDGSAIQSLVEQLDALCIGIAALELKPKEKEIVEGLERRVEQKKKAIEDAAGTRWTGIPLDDLMANRQRRAPFRYIETGPLTLQLVTV